MQLKIGGDIEVVNTSGENLGAEGKNLVGTDDRDTLIGDSGNDFIGGRKASDSLDGSTGNDSIYGDRELDTLTGGSGDDILFGGRGADSLAGDEGNDSLYGGNGNDTLLGGSGDDFLSGDNGDDFLIGGEGSDRFLLTPDSGIDSIANFETDTDKIVLRNGLSFEQLEITLNAGENVVKIAATGAVLANVSGVSGMLRSNDFVAI